MEQKSRRIYLIRHGEVAFQDGVHRCISRTDVLLDEEGRTQAEHLARYFARHRVTRIFTSPLKRCRETARILSHGNYPIEIEPGLREVDMGEWENLPLQELREKRGKTLESEPVHGEHRKNALRRFQNATDKILEKSEGDIVCVAHAGVNCCYLADLLGTPLETSRALPQPYGCMNLIEIEQDGQKRVLQYGIMSEKVPDEMQCRKLWDRCQTPEPVRSHCRAVSELAVRIGMALNQAGCSLNLELIKSGALLHDVARTRPDHAREGAKLLRKEGYPEVAEIIARHHDLQRPYSPGKPDETEVVYLADKLVKGSCEVSLEERFLESRKKCEAQEEPARQAALEAQNRRYCKAKQVLAKIEEVLGGCKIVENHA